MTRTEALARIRHDLGKYVVLQQRWLPPGATDGERRAAVLADVLETRRSPRSTDDAVAVWAGLAEERAVLSGALHLLGNAVQIARLAGLQMIHAKLR